MRSRTAATLAITSLMLALPAAGIACPLAPEADCHGVRPGGHQTHGAC